MYQTCLHCHASLGSNTEIETLPIGRALAFDAARGRLWIVCRRCRRWNLTPLDARFEAIEACERLYRDTPTRYASGEIGLAVRPSKLRLIRVGRPEREEFAFWRYGEQLVRRRRAAMLVAAVPLGLTAFSIAGFAGLVPFVSLAGVDSLYNVVNSLLTRARVPHPEKHGELVPLRLRNVLDWKLGRAEDNALVLVRPVQSFPTPTPEIHFHGDDATRVLANLLPMVNSNGAKRRDINDAARMLDSAGSPERFLQTQFARPDVTWSFKTLSTDARLALELAHAETRERHFLEGALDRLTLEWQEAERIAAIADNLLVPASVEAALNRLRGRQTPPTSSGS